MDVFACMYVCLPEEGIIKTSGTRFTDGYEPSCGCSEPTEHESSAKATCALGYGPAILSVTL